MRALSVLIFLAGAQAVAQSTAAIDSVRSPALASNRLGDASTRAVYIYLPPSYRAQSTRRFPVLYYLHGFQTNPTRLLDGSLQNFHLQHALDSLVDARVIPEMIVVLPDADPLAHQNVYLDSPVTGDWATFIWKDVVSFVDSRYRTIADRRHRALAGHSAGGFGALTLTFSHPDVFGMVYASSPAFSALVGEMSPADSVWAFLSHAAQIPPPNRVSRASGLRRFALSLSPDTLVPRLYGRLPFEPDASGALEPQPDVLRAWEERMPVGLAKRLRIDMPNRPEIFIESGLRDDNQNVLFGVPMLRAALDSAGVPYSLEMFDGGHVDRLTDRWTSALLPAVGRWFRAACITEDRLQCLPHHDK
jgi:enterochelin esterase-like enzyme